MAYAKAPSVWCVEFDQVPDSFVRQIEQNAVGPIGGDCGNYDFDDVLAAAVTSWRGIELTGVVFGPRDAGVLSVLLPLGLAAETKARSAGDASRGDGASRSVAAQRLTASPSRP